MSERLSDTNQRIDHLKKEWEAETDRVDRKLSELQTLHRVHDDKMARYNEERTRLM